MAILGKLIDKQTISVAGGSSDGVELLNYAHSLPATNPEMVLPNLRSIELVAADGSNGLPMVCGLGGNASQATVAIVMASAASVPTVMFDLYAVVWHSIRMKAPSNQPVIVLGHQSI